MSPASALDAETILAVAEDVLRRYGPDKATVLDVARVLGVSHGAVYRYFPSKRALREAVVRRWLRHCHSRLAAIAGDAGTDPPRRLRAWLAELFAASRNGALDDPELTSAYAMLAAGNSDVVSNHLTGLAGQIHGIVAEGIASGVFGVSGAAFDTEAAARAVLDATMGFHHPAHAARWSAPGIDAAFDRVCVLLVDGLRAR